MTTPLETFARLVANLDYRHTRLRTWISSREAPTWDDVVELSKVTAALHRCLRNTDDPEFQKRRDGGTQ